MQLQINNTYLIDACRKGDPKAQLQLFKLCFNQMFAVSIRLVDNARAADEIVKESFMTEFERMHACKGQADFLTRLRKLIEDRSVETWKRNNVPFPGLVTDRPIAKEF